MTGKQRGESNIRNPTKSFVTNADNFVVNSWLYVGLQHSQFRLLKGIKNMEQIYFFKILKSCLYQAVVELCDAVISIICQNVHINTFCKNKTITFLIATTIKLAWKVLNTIQINYFLSFSFLKSLCNNTSLVTFNLVGYQENSYYWWVICRELTWCLGF